MAKATPRVHTFHADAFALGGIMQRPYPRNVPVQASLSLPTSGGAASADSKDFVFEGGLFSFGSARSIVSGSYDPESKSWTTLASTSIERLNILNVITADLVVSQIATEHPEVGYDPKVTFLGTQFKNLSIAGRPCNIGLDTDFCDAARDYPKEPTFKRQSVLEKIASRQKRMHDAAANFQWMRERYDWTDPVKQFERSGHITCSLLTDNIPGGAGHVIELPNFGRVFLAELVIDRNSYQLTMIRLELGSPYDGSFSAAGSRANGTTAP